MVNKFKKKLFAFVTNLVVGSSFITSGFLGFDLKDDGYMGIFIKDEQSHRLSLGAAFLSKIKNPKNELSMFVTKEENQCYAKRANALFSAILGMVPEFPEDTKKIEMDRHKLYGYTGDCVGYMAVIMDLVNGTYKQQLVFLDKLIEERKHCPFCKMFAYSLRNLLVLTYINKYKDNSWDANNIVDDLDIMVKNDEDLMNCAYSIYGSDAVQNKIAGVFVKELIEDDEKVKKGKDELNLKEKSKKKEKNKSKNSNNIEEEKKESNSNKKEDKKESLDEILNRPQNYVKPENKGWTRIVGGKEVYIGNAEDRHDYEGAKANPEVTTLEKLKVNNLVSDEDSKEIEYQMGKERIDYCSAEIRKGNTKRLNKRFLMWAGDQLSGIRVSDGYTLKEASYTVLYDEKNPDSNHKIGKLKERYKSIKDGGMYFVDHLSDGKRLVTYYDSANLEKPRIFLSMDHYNPYKGWYEIMR